MKLRITVHAEGQYWDGGASIVVPDPMVMAFEPLKTTDDPIVGMATGDVLTESSAVKKKLKVREDASEYLSNAIVQHLLHEMRKRDTHNGYGVDV